MLSPPTLSTPLLDWLGDPSPERGISFATGSDGWERLSWAELAALARRCAGGLIERGVSPGDRVSLVAEASPAFVAGLFGTWLAGAVPTPCPPPLPFQSERWTEHLARLLEASEATCVLPGPGLERDVAAVAAPAHVAVAGLAELLDSAPAAEPPGPAKLGLVQFTSGSTRRPRPIPIGHAALAANVGAIRRWLDMTAQDGTASWLPVHHDMGLIGCLLTPASAGSDLHLMTPEQFVRRPLRYLRCFHSGGARLSAMPGFGLELILRRVAPEALDGLALDGWRTLIVGAERLHTGMLARFEALLAPHGFSAQALAPAYGLAEATLAVTGVAARARWRSAAVGDRVAIGDRVATGDRVAAGDAVAAGPATEAIGGEAVVGCGRPLHGVRLHIAGEDRRPLPEGTLGEIVVDGACTDGPVFTGDGGFLRDGELFVLGRLGDGLKLRGHFVFAEDVEADLIAAGTPPRRVAALLGHHQGRPTVAVVLDDPPPERAQLAAVVARRRAPDARVHVLTVPRGAIPRTTSGKARRRDLWRAYVEDRLTPNQPSTRMAQPQEGVHA